MTAANYCMCSLYVNAINFCHTCQTCFPKITVGLVILVMLFSDVQMFSVFICTNLNYNFFSQKGLHQSCLSIPTKRPYTYYQVN